MRRYFEDIIVSSWICTCNKSVSLFSGRYSILCMHFLLNADCRMDPMSVSKYMNETNSDIISYVRLNATWKLELLKVSRNPYLMAVVRMNWKGDQNG